MGMLLDAMGIFLDAMLGIAVALSTAAGVLAVVAINAERKQKLLIRRALDAALREGGQVKGNRPRSPKMDSGSRATAPGAFPRAASRLRAPASP